MRFLLFCIVLCTAACSYTLKVQDGRTAHDRKQYATGIPMLHKEFERAKSRADKGQLAFLLGDAYRLTGQYDNAVTWFKTAYDNNYGPDALREYAYGLKKLERYAEARQAFKELGIEIGSPYEYRKEITAVGIAEAWLAEAGQSGYKIENAEFNSSHHDFAPALYSGNRLVFTSDRLTANGERPYLWTGNPFMDLFMVTPESSGAQAFDEAVNSDRHEGTACFNKDFTEIFFVRAVEAYKGDDAFNKIFVAQKLPDGSWSEATPLPFQRERLNYLHPALSADGNTLFFANDDPEGWGGMDLYAVQRNTRAENGWEEPRLLSRNINTPGNEAFPTLDKDTLYFASDGLPGMGGMDIFRTYKVDRNSWAPPINLKPPINSGADDFSFIVTQRENPKAAKPGDLLRQGYFSSNRPQGRGGDDIYRYEQRVPPPRPARDTVKKEQEFRLVLEGYVLQKIFAVADDPNSKMLGRKPLASSAVVVDQGGKKRTLTTDNEGFFTMPLEENTDYSFTASHEGFLANSTRFSTKGIARDPNNPVQTFEVEIVLDRIYRNREIVLENIYYDYDKWDIRPDAEPTLNRLAEVLKQNPGISIQLGSHTDCRGNDNYNQQLAQKRAESAVNYLIGQGIAGNRLSAVGYGESQPAASCLCTRCTETEHQANRRTTFKILE